MYGDTKIPDHLMLQLTKLPRLSVDHYLGNWIEGKYLDTGHPVVREIARITGGIGLFGLWHNQTFGRGRLERAVQMCADLNRPTRAVQRIDDKWVQGTARFMPGMDYGLALVFQPFRQSWGQWPDGTPPTHTGGYLAGELDCHRDAMVTWRDWLAEMNAALGSDVRVRYIVADIEPKGWFFKEGDAEWNDATVARYNDFYRLAMRVFPGAQYVMYGNLFKDAQDRYDGRERYDIGCTALYAPLDDKDYHQTMLEFADRLARQRCLKGFVPWLALGAGCVDGKDFNHDVKYPTLVSWYLGALIAKWTRGEVAEYASKVIGAGFYPGPLDPDTPGWLEQFIAYVWGFHGERM